MWNVKINLRGNIFLVIVSLLINTKLSLAQGKNYNWLLGYNIIVDTSSTSAKANLLIDSNSVTVIPETRKMPFLGSQANISDENGNLLISTNGCWLANSNGDTMLYGNNLNPSSFTTSWCTSTTGIPYTHSSIILPWPDNSDKYILFHQVADNPPGYSSLELYYTIIDLTLDSGLGGVDTTQKNIIVIQDILSNEITACKHANGRDWWIVALKDSTDIIYKILLTPSGISSVSTQTLGVPLSYAGEGQPTFSPDGNKFAYSDHDGPFGAVNHNIRLFDFDRCSGIFSNGIVIDLYDTNPGLGLAFSSNSNLLYSCSFTHVFQINVDSLTVDTVATYDGFASPFPPSYTVFWTMYRAANGKIYISTANSTLDLHYINFPDSAGIACDVKQHALHLPCYAGQSDVNHPNYYLGPVTGSLCDSLTGVKEHYNEINKFIIKPNPNNGNFNINYLLPQNKSGVFEVFDMVGKKIFKMPLPPWSSLQQIFLPKISDGIYNAVITSGGLHLVRKIVVMK
jgi:hypothetical protein